MIVAVAALLSMVGLAMAGPVPYTPTTPQEAGTTAQMCWGADKEGKFTNAVISLMDGDNYNMRHLEDLATGVDMTQDGFINWSVPMVSQYTVGYFFQASIPGDVAWLSRFIISSPSGQTSAAAHATQPDGAAIPWADGDIVNGSSVVSSASSSASSSSTVSSTASSSAPAQSDASSSVSSSSTASSSSASASASATSSGSVAPNLSSTGPQRISDSANPIGRSSISHVSKPARASASASNLSANQSGAASLTLSSLASMIVAATLLLIQVLHSA